MGFLVTLFQTTKYFLKVRRRQQSVLLELMEKTHVDNGEGNSSQSAQEFENVTAAHPTKNKFQM